mgnify:CR=1 FL=1
MLYIVDTSVILSDPKALERLADKECVLPLVVLTELEGKRIHPELGYPARMALRYLEQLRKEHGSLTEAIPTEGGGTIRVEVNHVDDSDLPAVLKTKENDNRILAVASNLAKDGNQVTLLTKDLPLRLKASIAGIRADDFDYESQVDADWTGIATIKVDQDVIDQIYHDEKVWIDETEIMPIHTGIILKYGQKQSALGRIKRDGEVHLVKDRKPMGLEGKNAGQTIALDLLSDPSIGIVSLGGLAGSGKTVMALAAGIAAVKDSASKVKKLVVFRPVTAVGNQDLGFLPGTAEEKMAPWSAAVYDALESFMKPNEIRDMRAQIEVLPLTHIRGRTLKDAFVVIDEAQNLDIMTLVTALSRLGEGSRVVLTHDVSQRDNLRVGKYDGIARVISTLSESDLFAHIALTKSERSDIAELVASSFDL